MRAIMLHHAGGDRYAYRLFPSLLVPEIEVITPELPGRGDRFSEKLLDNISAIVEDLFQQILPFTDQNYVLVGKSMGALTGYLLLLKMMKQGVKLPEHVVFGSRKSPDGYAGHVKIAHLNSFDFWEGVKGYGGCPPALLQHQELMEMYEPILRADFKALEEYVFDQNTAIPIPVNADVWTGENDRITEEETYGWKHFFSGNVQFKTLPGGHFFMYDTPEYLTEKIKEVLK